MLRFVPVEELFKGRHFDRDVVILNVRSQSLFRQAMKEQRAPTKITLDAYAASHRAVADLKRAGELPEWMVLRSSMYLNNLIGQDHRRIKQRLWVRCEKCVGTETARNAR